MTRLHNFDKSSPQVTILLPYWLRFQTYPFLDLGTHMYPTMLNNWNSPVSSKWYNLFFGVTVSHKFPKNSNPHMGTNMLCVYGRTMAKVSRSWIPFGKICDLTRLNLSLCPFEIASHQYVVVLCFDIAMVYKAIGFQWILPEVTSRWNGHVVQVCIKMMEMYICK